LVPSVWLDIVTPERLVYSDSVDAVVAPEIEGQLGILPHHCPLLTTLQAGELKIQKEEEEISIAVSGGFLEVRPDRVVVLADAADRDDEIDIRKAEEAKRQAEIGVSGSHATEADRAKAEAALRHALACLKIAGKKKSKRLTF